MKCRFSVVLTPHRDYGAPWTDGCDAVAAARSSWTAGRAGHTRWTSYTRFTHSTTFIGKQRLVDAASSAIAQLRIHVYSPLFQIFAPASMSNQMMYKSYRFLAQNFFATSIFYTLILRLRFTTCLQNCLKSNFNTNLPLL
jgi:hypothetical protein